MNKLLACLAILASLGCNDAVDPDLSRPDITVDQLLSQGLDLQPVDPAAALAKYRQAIEMNPNNPQALNNFALLSAETGNHDDAITALNRLRAVDPTQSKKTQTFVEEWSLSFLGGAHIELDMGDVDVAGENYELYIKYNPSVADGYTGRGNVLTAKREFARASEAFNEALRLNPADDMAYVGRGNLQIQLKQWDLAIESLTKALDIFPNHYPAYESRAVAYEGKGETHLATKDREAAQSLYNQRSGSGK